MRCSPRRSVRTVPGTRLAALIGESSDAQCYHHQAIDRLGDGLIVSAQDCRRRDRGGRDLAGRRDVRRLAVQWHPEERLDDLRLFVAVVEAATRICDRKGDRGRGREEHDSSCLHSDQPRHGAGAAHRRAGRRGRRRRRRGARRRRATGLGRAARPPTGPPRLRSFAAVVDAHVDELAALEVANSGHPIGNARVGGRPRPRRAAVLLRQPGTAVRQADSGGRRPGRHLQRAARRRRRHHPVELPDDDRVVGFRARAGRGQRGAGQAGRVDAADHDPARRAGAARPGCPTTCSRCCPARDR